MLIALVALAVLVAGCGGDQLSQEEYEQELSQAAEDLSQASERLGTELSSAMAGDGDFAQAAEELGAVRDQLNETADGLDGVEPPEEAADAHDRLVDALRAYSGELEQFQGALEDGDTAEITESLSGLENLESLQDLQEAGAELEELGYTFETT